MGLAGATRAQTAPDQVQQASPKSIMIVTPHAPIARQVAPLVPPVRRIKPNAVAAKTPAKDANPVAQAAKAAETIAPPVSDGLAPAAPAEAAVAKSATAAPTAATTATKSSVKSSVTTHSAKATVATPVAAAKKFVAYTCKIGQEFSLARKACYTPGVTKAANDKTGGQKRLIARAKPPLDQSARSALGAKPKQ